MDWQLSHPWHSSHLQKSYPSKCVMWATQCISSSGIYKDASRLQLVEFMLLTPQQINVILLMHSNQKIRKKQTKNKPKKPTNKLWHTYAKQHFSKCHFNPSWNFLFQSNTHICIYRCALCMYVSICMPSRWWEGDSGGMVGVKHLCGSKPRSGQQQWPMFKVNGGLRWLFISRLLHLCWTPSANHHPHHHPSLFF